MALKEEQDREEHDGRAGDWALCFHNEQQVAAGRGDVVDSRHKPTMAIPVLMMPMHDARLGNSQTGFGGLTGMVEDDGLRLPSVEGALLDAMTPHVEASERRREEARAELEPKPLVLRMLLTLLLVGGLVWAWTLEAFGPPVSYTHLRAHETGA